MESLYIISIGLAVALGLLFMVNRSILKQLNTENDRLKNRLSDCQKDVEMIDNLREQLALTVNEVALSNNQILAANGNLLAVKLEAENAFDLAQRIEQDYKKKIALKDSQIRELKRANTTLRDEIRALNAQLKRQETAFRDRVRTLTAELQSVKDNNSGLLQSLEQMKVEIETIKNKYNESKD